ncbi:protease-like protein [Actinidia rufa]|uniref:Protease-like protein n=1 Tax=Actinidia rufa TaxID=165716 RepID=A0A7J0G5Z8_9ERIC|nr:protease-like protein [Actinidia rufa]
MVRVRGPDPKGLKMRNHAFHLYNSGKSTLSASGILLPGSSANHINGGKDAQWLPGSALVVTVASIVEPFLSLQHRENMSQGKKWVENDAKSSDERVPHWLSAWLLALVDVPVTSSAIQSLIEASSASLEHGWEVGWSLASYSDGPQPLANAKQSQRRVEQCEACKVHHITQFRIITYMFRGVSDDFSPSACVGVVAKVVEAKRPLAYWTSQQANALGHFPAMLETTAAVHPVSSGGAVVNSDGHMVGLVTRAVSLLFTIKLIATVPFQFLVLCSLNFDKRVTTFWEDGGYFNGRRLLEREEANSFGACEGLLIVELTGCRRGSLGDISGECVEEMLDGKYDTSSKRVLHPCSQPSQLSILSGECGDGNIFQALVNVGDVNIYVLEASGLRRSRGSSWRGPCLLERSLRDYIRKDSWRGEPFGSLERSLERSSKEMLLGREILGEGRSWGSWLLNGYPWRGEPSSKDNARHGGGTVIPHLNFSIPCAALEPIFMFSKESLISAFILLDMKDLSLLEGLDKPNEHLSSVWALVPPLSPKPGPPLPCLPQPQPGDTNTDGKASAKFMAERHGILRKSNQLDKTERLSKEFHSQPRNGRPSD